MYIRDRRWFKNRIDSRKTSGKFIKEENNILPYMYEVENITKEKEKLIKNGAFLLSDEKEAVLFSNRKVCFLMTSYGMIELLEK